MKLSDTDSRVLDMVRRATRAGGALSLPQIRERLGNSRGGNVNRIVHKLAGAKLVIIDRDADFDGLLSIRAPQA